MYMTARQMKQLIYGLIYSAFLFVIILGVYTQLLKPVPSCVDNTKNQGEAGVDCGGPCAKVCLPQDLKEISVLSSSFFVSTPGHYTLLGQVANTNAGFAVPSFEYRFDLYDASGTLLTSIPGHSFIYSGEVKYLLAPNVSVASSVGRVELKIANPEWTSSEVLGFVPQFKSPLPITGSMVSSSTVTVSGQLVNQDISSFNDVLIVAIFYGSSNRALGASQTVVDHIAPNETANFSVIYPATPDIDPSRTKLFAYALRP